MINVEIPKHTIIKYLRDRKGRPCGALVAVRCDEGFKVGFSLCNKIDRFSKTTAIGMALERATKDEEIPLPHMIRKSIPSFLQRCSRYYRIPLGE